MPEISLPNKWDPRPDQMGIWNYLQSGGKRAVIRAHRRFGKDDIALNWSAVSAILQPGMYWHCLPEYSQGRKAIWDAVDSHTGRRRIDQAFPHEIRRKTRNDEMLLEFASNSTWQVVGSDRYNALVGAGPRGLVLSEAALADPEAWDYLQPMVEESNGWVIFISTVRGRNWFYQLGEYAKTNPDWYFADITVDHTNVFTKDQLRTIQDQLIARWGDEIGLAKYRQEYFNDPDVGSFAAFISSSLVRRGTEYKAEGYQQEPRVWGLDVARAGEDRSVLIERQGRKARIVQTWHEPDSMRLASFVAMLWQDQKPDMVFVDGGGVGGPVADRLRQLLSPQCIQEVNFGWAATDPTKYDNKRAEMWGRIKDALSLGLELPNDSELIEELSGPEFTFTNKNQILLEKKESMKARGLRSPDKADALALTYAEPVFRRAEYDNQDQREEWETGSGSSWMGR